MTAAGGWYPVALAGGVEAGTSNGMHLRGEEIVVWRDAAGAAHIWDDRCPHRGMRLSFGFVRGDRIACLYHGWQYGADGSCLAIPAHPGLQPPVTIVAERRDRVEALGMIWAGSAGEPGRPPVPEETVGQTVTPIRSLHVDRPLEDVAARLAAFDLPPFHPDLAEGARRGARRDGPLVIVTAEKGYVAETLIAGLQPLDHGHTAVHLAMAANVGDHRGPGQAHFARLAELFRHVVESEAMSAASERAA
ncbi:MAG: Rieske 2Fe-2S domain-containing protein [Bauldia sp.]